MSNGLKKKINSSASAASVTVIGKYMNEVCRRYVYSYPDYIKFYIDSYREMWDSDE